MRAAIRNGVMLLPGSGGSVAMLGCLAARAIENVPEPARLRIVLMVSGAMARGSAIRATENVTVDCLARESGVLVPSDPAALDEFDFGSGPAASFAPSSNGWSSTMSGRMAIRVSSPGLDEPKLRRRDEA